MDTYNGYKNKDTWHAMLYINNNELLYNNIYKTVYNMIEANIIKDIICTYIYSQLETDIQENNLSIDIDKISITDIYEHIYLDVEYNERINLVKNIDIE